MLANVDLSVIMVVRDKRQFSQVSKHVLAQHLPGIFEFVVVDFGSQQQDVVKELRKLNLVGSAARSVRVLSLSPKPKMFNRGRAINVGFRWAFGRFFFILDADVLIPPDYLLTLVSRAKVNKCIRCVGKESNTKRVRRWCGSGIMLVPMEAAYVVGGYDESFVGYGEEDLDFHKRLQMAGYLVVTMSSPGWVHLSHSNKERGQAQPCSRLTGVPNRNRSRRLRNEQYRIVNPNAATWGSEDKTVKRLELK